MGTMASFVVMSEKGGSVILVASSDGNPENMIPLLKAWRRKYPKHNNYGRAAMSLANALDLMPWSSIPEFTAYIYYVYITEDGHIEKIICNEVRWEGEIKLWKLEEDESE